MLYWVQLVVLLALGITYPLITLSTIAQTAAKRRKQKKQAPPRMVKPQPTVSLTTLEKIAHVIQNNAAYIAAKEILKRKRSIGIIFWVGKCIIWDHFNQFYLLLFL